MAGDLTKFDVGERQLNTAIRIFFGNGDAVSVHTLACAACEIFETLGRKLEKPIFLDHVTAVFPEMDEQKYRKMIGRYKNHFKHANRDWDKTLKGFNDYKNNYILLVATYDYMHVASALSAEAQVYQAWYFALQPERLAPSVLDPSAYESLFPGVRELPRHAQKRMAFDALSWFREPGMR